MPPKKERSRKGSKVGGDKPTQMPKPPANKQEGPVWFKMGRHHVQFISDARALSNMLRDTYGEKFSINMFEKSLAELAGKAALKDKVYIPEDLLSAFVLYEASKKSMIEEQQLFKSSFLARPVTTDVPTSVADLFRSPPQTGKAEVQTHPAPESSGAEAGKTAPETKDTSTLDAKAQAWVPRKIKRIIPEGDKSGEESRL